MREALAAAAVLELFATADAMRHYPELTGDAAEISVRDAAALSETVTPQGLVAVCAIPAVTVAEVFAGSPRLLVVLVEPNEPGNLGAIVRTADAAGADAVLVDGGVDPFNGKAVRASAGSLFHLPVVSGAGDEFLDAARAHAITTLATAGHGDTVDLDALIDLGELASPTAWLFGSEAHGLPASLLERVDRVVRVPIHGRAESLNLAAAAAVCLYASARAHRQPDGGHR